MLQTKKKLQRIGYIDIAKGIAILSVFLGHMDVPILNKIVYTFHMPLFFLISGYFISDDDEKISSFMKRKTKHLMLAYIFTSICVVLINIIRSIVLMDSNIVGRGAMLVWAAIYGSGNAWETPYHIEPIGTIWFLMALCVALFIVKLCINKTWGSACVVILAYIGYKTAQFVWLPFNVQSGMTASLFVYLGYQGKKNEVLKRVNYGGLFFCLILWIFCIIFGGNLYMVRNYYGNGFLDIFGSIAASYFILNMSKFIEKHIPPLSCGLQLFGRYSMVLMCTHLIELNFMIGHIYRSIYALNCSMVFIYILLFLYKISFCTILILIFYKIPIINKIFFKNKSINN